MKNFSKEEKTKLLNSKDYREFIKLVCELKSTQTKKFGYSDLARFSGFVSRSFPRDIVLGKKNLTHESLLKISKGLGLPKRLDEYFRLLVELDSPASRTEDRTNSDIQRRMMNLKSRILKTESDILKNRPSPFIHLVPKVYAALGAANLGAKLEDIMQRTSLKSDEVNMALSIIMDYGLAVMNGPHYFAVSNHVSLQKIGQEANFMAYYKSALEETLSTIQMDFKNPDCLFFHSAFSVSKKKLPALKEELREVLLKYVDGAEMAEGDKVVTLICALR